jgi:hypothetical protein
MSLGLDLKILARSKFFAKFFGMNACRAQVAMNLAANFFLKKSFTQPRFVACFVRL